MVRGLDDPDKIVTEPLEPIVEDDPACARTKTAPRPRPGHRIEIDIDDADSLSDFLLTISKLVREKRKITIVVE